MKTRFLVAMMMALCLTAFSSRASAKEFKNSDFKGTYAFNAQGTFEQNVLPLPVPQSGTIVQVGVYKPDGKGILNLSPCRVMANGDPETLFEGFLMGTYTVNSDGIIVMDTTLFDADMNFVTTSGCRGVLSGPGADRFDFFTIPVLVPGFTNLQNQHGSSFKQAD